MLELNLTQNTNSNIQANGYNPVGKYYARVEPKEQYDLSMLADHMHEHNAAFSEGLITGVVTDMVRCIHHLVLAGNSVKIPNLGIFKASIEANGLTLSTGAKVSAGKGSQRTDAELQADITRQQSAVRCVKLIMQATGDTTKDDLSSEAKLSLTKAAKDRIKSKTGRDAEDPSNGGSLTPDPSPTGEGSENQGGGSSQNSGNSGSQSGSGDNGGGGNDDDDFGTGA